MFREQVSGQNMNALAVLYNLIQIFYKHWGISRENFAWTHHLNSLEGKRFRLMARFVSRFSACLSIQMSFLRPRKSIMSVCVSLTEPWGASILGQAFVWCVREGVSGWRVTCESIDRVKQIAHSWVGG